MGVAQAATSPKEVFEEIAKVVPLYMGMTYARLDMTEFVEDAIPMPAALSYKQLKIKSLMWPCKDRMDPGTPVLYTSSFATASGKAQLWVGQAQPSQGDGQNAPDGSLMATFGFPLFPFRSGTLSRQSYGLSRVEPDPRLHLNTSDATRLGIADQVPVNVLIDGSAEF